MTDERFPEAVHELLRAEPRSEERKLRLAGVVSRQMSRAAARFDMRQSEIGLASVKGALYLVRTGELSPEMLGPDGARALKGAALEYGKRGDDGRARAIYELLVRVAPEKERGEVNEHLEAVKGWTQSTAGRGVMQSSGALESAAVARRMLEPSVEARDEAQARAAAWIAQSYELRRQFRERRVQPEREEALEAIRALGTGPTVLAAIHLRDADAAAALGAIDRADARDLARPDMISALERVADHAEASAWLGLLRALRNPSHDADEAPQDAHLLRAVTFCVAAEAYRLDPTIPEVAGVVSEALIDLGMPDVAPAVLVEAVRAHPDPHIVSGAMALTLTAMLRAAEAEDLPSARRAYAAAAPLLAIADGKRLAARTSPGPSRVRALLGEIEVREGRLREAQALLLQAVAQEKSGSILLSLARIDAHEQRLQDAQSRAQEALAKEDALRDPGLRGEVLLFQGDLLRDQGDRSGARAIYRRALEDLARARGASEGDLRARIERLIARLLDRFGDGSGAERALDRAYDASSRDKKQVAATVGQQIARAFLRGDLKAAQSGLARGVSADLAREDIVYYAVWVRLLERQARRPGEGVSERLLSLAADDPRWVGRIAAFGSGKVRGDDLVASARTPAQRTEALFYAAMEHRLAGDAKGSEENLRKSIAAGGLDLMEVSLAKDLLSVDKGVLGGPAPDVGLP